MWKHWPQVHTARENPFPPTKWSPAHYQLQLVFKWNEEVPAVGTPHQLLEQLCGFVHRSQVWPLAMVPRCHLEQPANEWPNAHRQQFVDSFKPRYERIRYLISAGTSQQVKVPPELVAHAVGGANSHNLPYGVQQLPHLARPAAEPPHATVEVLHEGIEAPRRRP
ncbi:hypothetical protein Pelo_7174 [Pelomyxa schiedti]|nr:hypothetical protein Pelo_7174 [Pelomyxa schiedti]